jgi:hypothetical protein
MDPTALGLLYAILRVANGLGTELASFSGATGGAARTTSVAQPTSCINTTTTTATNRPPLATLASFANMNPKGNLVVLKEWAAVPLLSVGEGVDDDEKTEEKEEKFASSEDEINFKDIFSILSVIKGSERTPPNRHDLVIYECIPNAMGFHDDHNTGNQKSSSNKLSSTNKIDIPFVPDAFVLTELLSSKECKKIISAAEAIGFVPDEPVMRTTALVAATAAGLDDRAANFTWLVDDSIMRCIMSRCEHLFPQVLKDGSQFVGMNARWRLYRYYPGSIYRPHVDGAWPQSGKVLKPSNGGGQKKYEYEYDISNGKVRSRLTFLIYLNEGFQGGHTSYFTPNEEREGEVLAHKVCPRQGMAVLFPHGEGAGSLVHEGSNLESGIKYVIRTDALYTTTTMAAATNEEEEEGGEEGGGDRGKVMGANNQSNKKIKR